MVESQTRLKCFKKKKLSTIFAPISVLDSVAKILDGLYENSKSACDASIGCQYYKIHGQFPELCALYERCVYAIHFLEIAVLRIKMLLINVNIK